MMLQECQLCIQFSVEAYSQTRTHSSLIYSSNKIWEEINAYRAKALGKAFRFSSVLPLIKCELTKTFPSITPRTWEKRMGASLVYSTK